MKAPPESTQADRHQIDRLKADWLADDRGFDLEDVPGFEAHRAELQAFRLAVEGHTSDAFKVYLEALAANSPLIDALRAFMVDDPAAWQAADLEDATRLKAFLWSIGTGIEGERVEADRLFRAFQKAVKAPRKRGIGRIGRKAEIKLRGRRSTA